MTLPPSTKICALALLALTLLCLCYTRASAQVESLSVDPPLPSRITMGETPTVKVKITPAASATPPPIADVKWSGIEGVLEIQNSTDEGNGVYSFTFKPAKVADAVSVTLTVGDKEQKFTVSVVPQITKETLRFEPNTLPAQDLTVRQQQQNVIVRLKLKDDVAVPKGALSAASDANNTADVLLSDTTLLITPKAKGTAKVTVSAYGAPVESFKVNVTEAVKEIRVYDQKFPNDKSKKPLSEMGIEVEGRDGTIWKGAEAVAKLNFQSTKETVVKVTPDQKELQIVDADTAQLRVSAREDPSIVRVITVTVTPLASQVKIIGSGNMTVLARQPPITVQARVEDAAGRLVPDTSVKFECEGAKCEDFVNVTNQPNNTAEIRGLKKTAAPISVVAKVDGDDDASPARLLVDVLGPDQITDFRPLLIRLDMIDEQTAKDLFGRKAADEFYIAKVQLFNNLKKTPTEYFGDSILVYSESLQVRVALEVKCRKEDVPPRRDGAITQCNKVGEWVPVTVDMVDEYFQDEFSLDPPISGTETQDPKDADAKLRPCFIKAPKSFVGLYRPYSFDTVAVTHDRRDERSLRSRILTTLNGAISFTSFVTAIAVPGPGSDLPLGLDKSNNLLIPSFEKLFPSMKEVQRQNILTMVMRNLEEIPFGGSVERKIFFPKGALEGLWPGHRVRITGVSTFDACAEAAIIKKVGQQ